MANSNDPFFILGCGRSGTSLLSKMLNQHSNIAVPLESHIYNTFFPLLKFYGDLNREQNRLRLIKDILSTDVMNDWEPSLTSEEILGCLDDHSFGGVFDALLKSWTKKNKKQRWGEKTPHHIDYWDEISKKWPDAKLIHIYRDGRDVALSFLNVRFGPKTICNAARHWVNYLQKVKEIKEIDPRMVLEIAYEDLLDDPEGTLKKICYFLQETYEVEMMEFYRNSVKHNTDEHNRQNLARPLITTNKEKWRNDMADKDVRLFEAIGGESLEENGYIRKYKNPAIHPLEIIFYDKLMTPVKKISAMLINSKGYKDAFIKIKIKISLRLTWYLRYQ